MTEFDIQRFENEGGAVAKEVKWLNKDYNFAPTHDYLHTTLHTEDPINIDQPLSNEVSSWKYGRALLGDIAEDDITVTREDYDSLLEAEAILNVIRRVISIAPKTQTIEIIAAIVDQAD